MTEPYYTITALENRAEIRIDGNIGGDQWDQESTTARAFITELSNYRDSPLTVYINSAGGSVKDAAAIYSALKRHTLPVSIVIDGWALSAASLIAMAGNTLTMGAISLMMLHNPSAAGFGNAADMRRVADILDTVRDTMITAYAAKTGADRDTVAGWLDAETWFTADQALAAKLADDIADNATPFSPAPPTAAFKNIPEAYAAYFQPFQELAPMAAETPTSSVSLAPPAEPTTVSVADIKAQISTILAAERQAERDRAAAIRASYSTFFKKMPMRAEALTALQEQVLADGSSPEEADHKLLELLGSFSEPLGAGQGHSDPAAIDPIAVSIAAAAYQREQKAAGRTISTTEAVAFVCKKAE